MNDPVASFLECHEKIRRFTTGLSRLAELEDLAHPLAPDTAAAIARYLEVGLPLHGADEDESLSPRLRGHAIGPDVVAALDRMTAEHHEMDAILPELVGLLKGLARAEAIDEARFRALSPRFVDLMMGHIAMEEATIFPACEVLDAGERTAILDELRRRRT